MQRINDERDYHAGRGDGIRGNPLLEDDDDILGDILNQPDEVNLDEGGGEVNLNEIGGVVPVQKQPGRAPRKPVVGEQAQKLLSDLRKYLEDTPAPKKKPAPAPVQQQQQQEGGEAPVDEFFDVNEEFENNLSDEEAMKQLTEFLKMGNPLGKSPSTALLKNLAKSNIAQQLKAQGRSNLIEQALVSHLGGEFNKPAPQQELMYGEGDGPPALDAAGVEHKKRLERIGNKYQNIESAYEEIPGEPGKPSTFKAKSDPRNIKLNSDEMARLLYEKEMDERKMIEERGEDAPTVLSNFYDSASKIHYDPTSDLEKTGFLGNLVHAGTSLITGLLTGTGKMIFGAGSMGYRFMKAMGLAITPFAISGGIGMTILNDIPGVHSILMTHIFSNAVLVPLMETIMGKSHGQMMADEKESTKKIAQLGKKLTEVLRSKQKTAASKRATELAALEKKKRRYEKAILRSGRVRDRTLAYYGANSAYTKKRENARNRAAQDEISFEEYLKDTEEEIEALNNKPIFEKGDDMDVYVPGYTSDLSKYTKSLMNAQNGIWWVDRIKEAPEFMKNMAILGSLADVHYDPERFGTMNNVEGERRWIYEKEVYAKNNFNNWYDWWLNVQEKTQQVAGFSIPEDQSPAPETVANFMKSGIYKQTVEELFPDEYVQTEVGMADFARRLDGTSEQTILKVTQREIARKASSILEIGGALVAGTLGYISAHVEHTGKSAVYSASYAARMYNNFLQRDQTDEEAKTDKALKGLIGALSGLAKQLSYESKVPGNNAETLSIKTNARLSEDELRILGEIADEYNGNSIIDMLQKNMYEMTPIVKDRGGVPFGEMTEYEITKMRERAIDKNREMVEEIVERNKKTFHRLFSGMLSNALLSTGRQILLFLKTYDRIYSTGSKALVAATGGKPVTSYDLDPRYTFQSNPLSSVFAGFAGGVAESFYNFLGSYLGFSDTQGARVDDTINPFSANAYRDLIQIAMKSNVAQQEPLNTIPVPYPDIKRIIGESRKSDEVVGTVVNAINALFTEVNGIITLNEDRSNSVSFANHVYQNTRYMYNRVTGNLDPSETGLPADEYGIRTGVHNVVEGFDRGRDYFNEMTQKTQNQTNYFADWGSQLLNEAGSLYNRTNTLIDETTKAVQNINVVGDTVRQVNDIVKHNPDVFKPGLLYPDFGPQLPTPEPAPGLPTIMPSQTPTPSATPLPPTPKPKMVYGNETIREIGPLNKNESYFNMDYNKMISGIFSSSGTPGPMGTPMGSPSPTMKPPSMYTTPTPSATPQGMTPTPTPPAPLSIPQQGPSQVSIPGLKPGEKINDGTIWAFTILQGMQNAAQTFSAVKQEVEGIGQTAKNIVNVVDEGIDATNANIKETASNLVTEGVGGIRNVTTEAIGGFKNATTDAINQGMGGIKNVTSDAITQGMGGLKNATSDAITQGVEGLKNVTSEAINQGKQQLSSFDWTFGASDYIKNTADSIGESLKTVTNPIASLWDDDDMSIIDEMTKPVGFNFDEKKQIEYADNFLNWFYKQDYTKREMIYKDMEEGNDKYKEDFEIVLDTYGDYREYGMRNALVALYEKTREIEKRQTLKEGRTGFGHEKKKLTRDFGKHNK